MEKQNPPLLEWSVESLPGFKHFDYSGFRYGHYKEYRKKKTPEKFAVIILKIEQFDFMIRKMHPKDADGMANLPSENLGSLW